MKRANSGSRLCKHGDRTCPCQDGDPCHYEWFEETPPMRCPTTRIIGCQECK